jgi:hypothetical protein
MSNDFFVYTFVILLVLAVGVYTYQDTLTATYNSFISSTQTTVQTVPTNPQVVATIPSISYVEVNPLSDVPSCSDITYFKVNCSLSQLNQTALSVYCQIKQVPDGRFVISNSSRLYPDNDKYKMGWKTWTSYELSPEDAINITHVITDANFVPEGTYVVRFYKSDGSCVYDYKMRTDEESTRPFMSINYTTIIDSTPNYNDILNITWFVAQ